MDLLDKLTGKIKKLEIRAFKDKDFKSPVGEVFKMQFNPKALQVDYSVTLSASTDKEPGRYVRTTSPDIVLDFVLDGTGIDSSIFDGFKKVSVEDRLKHFFSLCKDVNDSTHEPPYVEISYGSLIYQSRLKSANVAYTLFGNDGSPLRATVKATFANIKSSITDGILKSLNSPDVTHKRTLAANQSLCEVANEIYERNDLYPEVARVNGLNTFRKTTVKQDIFFPPINK